MNDCLVLHLVKDVTDRLKLILKDNDGVPFTAIVLLIVIFFNLNSSFWYSQVQLIFLCSKRKMAKGDFQRCRT